nr:unnamed protein product [Spirometra erinaceieuropaei]
MPSAMLMDAYRGERPGTRIVYRMDDQLLNRQRMRFQSRVSTTTVHELAFADDRILKSTSEREMQRSMDLFTVACNKFVLVINTEKTGHAPIVTQHSPSPQCVANQRERNLTAGGRQLHVFGQHPLPQHQNRRYSCLPHFQSQSSLRPSAEHRLEPSRSPSQHPAEDVQGNHPADAVVGSGNLDGL